jgi:hypothetical protein
MGSQRKLNHCCRCEVGRLDGHARLDRHHPVDLVEHLLDRDSLGMDRDRAPVDARDDQEVFDQALQPPCLTAGTEKELLGSGLGWGELGAVDRVERPDDGGEGAAQLVADGGHEVGLHLCHFLETARHLRLRLVVADLTQHQPGRRCQGAELFQLLLCEVTLIGVADDDSPDPHRLHFERGDQGLFEPEILEQDV